MVSMKEYVDNPFYCYIDKDGMLSGYYGEFEKL